MNNPETVEWAIEQAIPTLEVNALHFAYGELLYTTAEQILQARERLLHEPREE